MSINSYIHRAVYDYILSIMYLPLPMLVPLTEVLSYDITMPFGSKLISLSRPVTSQSSAVYYNEHSSLIHKLHKHKLSFSLAASKR
jgi:hypothetical protein